MKITRANVEEYALNKGLERTDLDAWSSEGIPEGFIWKEPDIEISGVVHKGRIIKFKPLADWADKNAITYE